jgi:hypothetical protein
MVFLFLVGVLVSGTVTDQKRKSFKIFLPGVKEAVAGSVSVDESGLCGDRS